jgi:hypothetical protein
VTEFAIVLATITLTGGVLFLGTYRRGGAEAVRANARPLLTIFAGAVVVASILGVLSATGPDARRILAIEASVVTVALAAFLLLLLNRR